MPALNPRAIRVDGVSLDSYAFALQARTGLDSTPGLRGDNLVVPGRDGEVWQPKDYGTGRLVLDLFVTGMTAEGDESTPEDHFRSNLDALLAVFGKRYGLLRVERDEVDGTRVAFGEVQAVIAPDYPGDDAFATLKVEVVLPDPLWQDTAAVTSSAAPSATSPIALTLTEFAGMTAPVPDAVLLVPGPITNPKIVDDVSGASIALTGTTVAAGDVWRVRAGDFVSEVGTGLDFTGGTASSVLASTVWSPGPHFLPLTPDPLDRTPSLTLTGSGLDTTTALKVQGVRRFF